jgi:hypothetical protein
MHGLRRNICTARRRVAWPCAAGVSDLDPSHASALTEQLGRESLHPTSKILAFRHVTGDANGTLQSLTHSIQARLTNVYALQREPVRLT